MSMNNKGVKELAKEYNTPCSTAFTWKKNMLKDQSVDTKTVAQRPADKSPLDKLMPHPIYGWMTWVCVLNPTLKTIELIEADGWFEEAYRSAVSTINKKLKIYLFLR